MEFSQMSIWLVMQTTDGTERPFAVKKPQTVIGRENNCDLRIPVPAVSQRHCRITFDGSELKITDLDSDQGTFHNGNRIKEALLAHADRLKIGPVTFVVRVNEDLDGLNASVPEITIVRHDGQPPSLANRLNLPLNTDSLDG
jgi:pSer/pThr/pTyr-binding forkhead associated (FHA) protein